MSTAASESSRGRQSGLKKRKREEGQSTASSTAISEGQKRALLKLSANLDQLREGGQYTDIEICVQSLDGKKKMSYRAHRCILASRSDHFRGLFSVGMKDSNVGNVTLEIPEPESFREILRWMYCGELKLTPERAIDVLGAADALCLDEVVDFASSFISSNLTLANCLEAYSCAARFNRNALREATVQYIGRHLSKLVGNRHFNSLDLEDVVALLSSNSLAVQGEEAVFEAATEWLKSNPNAAADDAVVRNLFDCCRLPRMSWSFLSESVVNSLLFRNLPIFQERIVEAFRYQAAPQDKRAALESERMRSRSVVPALKHTWSSSRKSRSIEVSGDLTLATHRGGTDSSKSIVGSQSFPSTGRHYFEVVFSFQKHNCYYVGVVGKTFGNFDISRGITNEDGWAFHDHDGKKGHARHSQAYASSGFSSGDRVGVLVDMDTRQLSFFVNGNAKGVAFSDLPDTLYPAATLFNDGSTVQFVDCDVPLAVTNNRQAQAENGEEQ